ncbi:MAG: Gfo/Idh/MocA family oxidoreductase [Planctomycetota bacterium]
MEIGVIGYGYWGPNLVRNLVENNLCKRVVVCDARPGRLEAARRRWPGIETRDTMASVVEDPAIDAVLIATPIATHAPLAIRALEEGKHVFVEKPMAASPEEAERLLETARRTQRTLMVGHTFLFSPPVAKTREIIRSGELGQVVFVTSTRVNLGLHQKDVSVIWDLGPHDFSILLHLLDECPYSLSACGRAFVREPIADVAFINMRFLSGAVGTITVSWLAPSKIRKLTVVGSRKMLVYDDCEPSEKVKVFDKGVEFKEPQTFGEFQLSYRTGDIYSPRIDNSEPIRNELTHFIHCCETGEVPLSDARFGLNVVKALAAAEESLRNDGHPVALVGLAARERRSRAAAAAS